MQDAHESSDTLDGPDNHDAIDSGIDDMKELIAFMARALVDKPDAVDVTGVEGERTYVFELVVDPEDLGKVIGKEGRTARAMRTLLSATSAKQKKRAVLEILE